jgi:hypothetical protein
VFKPKDPEERARRDAERAAVAAKREADKASAQAERERQAFLATPVGRAREAFERGDLLFQYAHDVESQDAVVIAMVGSTTTRRSTDPSEILNAVAREGWSLVNASFVFREQGSQSRDKFLSSGQNIAVKGTTIGYYVFERRDSLRADNPG